MKHDIKKQAPSKRYKGGQINPHSCKKLFESQINKPIIYRSSYERDFIYWLERSPRVVHWGSECIGIPYQNLRDGTHHTYYPDYIMEVLKDQNDPSKGVDVILVEIKPFNQTKAPDPCLPKDSYAWNEYVRNVSKWKAAQQYCEKNNMVFKIFTEKTISRL